ncbi:ricin-type beta-trefoil lectin domain protein [Polyangium sp. 15x6]|uniref:ricin-type beta-trefoil lectin domain protein n=1 Tax=Polyangium sp. 15x6 TaxID=3042687 RepID=UPI00249B2BDD|nr:ricin-type beta-trefoil lectin domain protein [Polyangium sp. 15x6]MDI3282954.1 ricin-type beta-trefoil lectin domain protein [Polyangium sp. 15x6]
MKKAFVGSLLVTFAFTSQEALAAFTIGDPNCGQIDQPACTIDNAEWWDAGACDRGLNNVAGMCRNGTRSDTSYPPGWVVGGLRHQRTFLNNQPINALMLLSAHNAFNNQSDGYAFWEHQNSMTEQLNMGVRALMLDLHYVNGGIRLCHGQSNGAGCAAGDRPFYAAVEEIRNWLDANPKEIVVFALEDYVCSNGYAGDFEAAVDFFAGDLVFRPSDWTNMGGTLGSNLPTLNDVIYSGKQLIMTGPNSCNGWVWTSNQYGSLKGWPGNTVQVFDSGACTQDGTALAPTYTSLSLLSSTIKFAELEDRDSVHMNIAAALNCNMTRLNLNLVDNNKMAEAVWSWSAGEPNDAGGAEDCTSYSGDTGRWNDLGCSTSQRYACVDRNNRDTWVLTTAQGAGQSGHIACSALNPNYIYSPPKTPYENRKLFSVVPWQTNVWINMNDVGAEGHFVTGPESATFQRLQNDGGYCLALENGGTSNGTNLLAATCSSADAQKWSMDSMGRIHPYLAPHMCIDADLTGRPDGMTQWADKVHLYVCNTMSVNQQWRYDTVNRRLINESNKVFSVAEGRGLVLTAWPTWTTSVQPNQNWTSKNWTWIP